MSDVLSIIAIIISGLSFVFAIFAFIKSHNIAKKQLQIEEAREKGRVAEQASASLIAYFHLENKRRTLRIENKGKGEARNITIFLDNQPIEEHHCWIKQNKIKTLCGMGFGDYLIALTMGSPIPSEAEIHWDDDDKKDKVSRTTLTL